VAAAVLGLATADSAWLSALIIARSLGGVAGLLALQGKAKMREVTPLVAEQITASVKEEVQWARSRAQAGRQYASKRGIRNRSARRSRRRAISWATRSRRTPRRPM